MMLPHWKNRKYGILLMISVLLLLLPAISQASNTQSVKISGPEFMWAMAHPFIAAKARKMTKYAMHITDSLENAHVLHDRSGGQLDAFKHAFWMAVLSQEFKPKKVYKLGLAHERFNFRQVKKAKGGGDKAASDMDLWNNKVGIDMGYVNRNISKDSLISLIVSAVKSGKMRIIKKNSRGDSLDKNNQLIDNSTLKTWENPRCLVASDYKYN